MLRAWRSPEIRATMDIDLLGRTNNAESALVDQMRDIISTNVEPDGLIYDLASIKTERITEDADYEGTRFRLVCFLGNMKINIQVDIGFGDVVHPEPDLIELPGMLDLEAPRLYGYSRESTIAEKFNAMVKLEDLNSRMKDFYDIWLLSRQYKFASELLAEAIKLTFNERKTDLPDDVKAFTDRFIQLKQKQWTAFHKRLKNSLVPSDFKEIVDVIKDFLLPVIKSIIQNGSN